MFRQTFVSAEGGLINPRYARRTIVLLTAFAVSFCCMLEPVVAQADELPALHAKVIELENSGRYAEAIGFAQRELAIQEKTFGPDHPDVATSLNQLAQLYGKQGRYPDAEPMLKRARAIWEKTLGPNNVKVGAAISNLAELYRSEGRNAEAEPLFKQSLSIQEKGLGRDHPNVAATLRALAVLCSTEGRY